MISCGEPSGDLYAGALAVEIRRRQPDAAIFGLGGQRLMAGGGRAARRLPRSQRDRARRGAARVPRSLVGAATGWSRPRAPRSRNALVVIDFPDFNFRLAVGGQEARHPDHLLHQPAAMGVAARAGMQVDEAARRSRAGDFSVRGADVSRCRRAGAVRRPSARRSGARAGAAETVSSGARLDPARPIVALLPGSRPNEVERLLPIMRDSGARRLPRDCPARSSSSRARRRSTISLFSEVTWNGEPTGRSAGADRRCAGDIRRRDYRIGHGDGSGGAARPADGRRVPAVAADLPARPAIRARRQRGDGESDCRAPDRARADSGRLHRREHCRRNAVAADRSSARTTRCARALGDVRAKLGAPGASGRAAEAVLEMAEGKSRGV